MEQHLVDENLTSLRNRKTFGNKYFKQTGLSFQIFQLKP